MIPLSVNGAGWREASYILLFQSVAIGVDAQQATHQAATLSLLWLGIVIITSLPGGIIYLLRGGRARETQGLSRGAEDETHGIGAPLEPSREEEPISTI